MRRRLGVGRDGGSVRASQRVLDASRERRVKVKVVGVVAQIVALWESLPEGQRDEAALERAKADLSELQATLEKSPAPPR